MINMLIHTRKFAWGAVRPEMRPVMALALLFVGAPAIAADLFTIDGDTVVIDGTHIRIANIDAPEIGHAKCDAERRLGLVAKRRMDELMNSGPITIHVGDPGTGRKIDRYGRTLATIEVDGQDVGEIIIAEGLARPWAGKRQPWCD